MESGFVKAIQLSTIANEHEAKGDLAKSQASYKEVIDITQDLMKSASESETNSMTYDLL